MIATRASRWKIVLAACLAAPLVVAVSLSTCSRDEGTDVGAALDRANRELLDKVGWGVRREEDVEWLTQLGRGDTIAWEIVLARRGTLDVRIVFGPGAQATVAVPVEPGHQVHVIFRPRLGESGLENHRRIEPGKTVPPGWTSWGVSSERWGACLTVLAPCSESQRIEVTVDGMDRVDWDWLDGQYSTLERPLFRRALGGTEVEGTPTGSLAIPAAARITGQTMGVLPGGFIVPASQATAPSAPPPEARLMKSMSFPATPGASVLLTELTWSTRLGADAPPVNVGTWEVRATVRFKDSAGIGTR